MTGNLEETAKIFKAFCDENRLRILSMLRGGEKCACKLLEALRISQPTLSHHMRILCDSGIVSGRREGKWTHYRINRNGAEKAGKLLAEFTGPFSGEKEQSDCSCKNRS